MAGSLGGPLGAKPIDDALGAAPIHQQRTGLGHFPARTAIAGELPDERREPPFLELGVPARIARHAGPLEAPAIGTWFSAITTVTNGTPKRHSSQQVLPAAETARSAHSRSGATSSTSLTHLGPATEDGRLRL